MKIISGFYQVKSSSQNTAASKSNVNCCGGPLSGQIAMDTVSFSRKTTLPSKINQAAMTYIRELAQRSSVGEKFHRDFLEPATRILAERGLKVRAVKKGDEYFAKLVVHNSSLYRRARANYRSEIKAIKSALPSHSTSGLTTHNYPESEFLYDKFIAATTLKGKASASNVYKGANENHAIALLITAMHNEKLLCLGNKSLSPNRVLAEELPTISGVNHELDYHLKPLFTSSEGDFNVDDFNSHKRYAVDLLFPKYPSVSKIKSSSVSATSTQISGTEPREAVAAVYS